MSLWRLHPLKPKAMLDWPLQSHRSPTTTLLKVTVLAPLSVALRSAPVTSATIASSITCQLPEASAVVDFVWLL